MSEPAISAVLEGGTDAASMLIFDPAALPDDFDSRIRDDPVAVLEPLAGEGRLYWLNTQADGGYNLGVLVGRDLRSEHAAHARKMGVAERFAAPSGMLYFAGVEYAFRHDDSFLRKHPHMGSCLKISPGDYHLTLFDMDYPNDFHEDLLRQRLSRGRFRLYALMNWLAPLGCVSTLATVISAFPLGLRMWSRIALPLWVALVVPALVLSRLRPYREAVEVRQAIEREYPGFIATLRPVMEPSTKIPQSV